MARRLRQASSAGVRGLMVVLCRQEVQGEVLSLSLPGGVYRIRIAHAGGAWGESGFYRVEIGGGGGGLVGIRTISTRVVGRDGNSVGDRFGDPSRGALPPLYGGRQVYFAGGATPSLDTFQEVTFGPPPRLFVCDRAHPAVAAWFAAPERAANHSVAMLQIGDFQYDLGQEDFSLPVHTPIRLRLQLTPTAVDLAGPCSMFVEDVPNGYVASVASIMAWDPVGNEWVVLDPAPTALGGGVFETSLSNIAPWVDHASLHECYFALMPAEALTVPDWSLLED